MRQSWIKTIRAFFVPLLALMLSACQIEDFQVPHTRPHEVGFYVGGGTQTRTEMLPNGLSAVWTAGDELAVWAKNSSGDFTLSNQIFKTYGIDGKRGFFTSTLDSPMPDDDYTYYCTYPAPISVNGTKATFNIPAVQDGKVSGGADIMIATPVSYGALTPVPDPEDHSGMRMQMNRMLHQFRFYVPQDDALLRAKEIKKILIDFPVPVAGDVVFDINNPSSDAILSDSSSSSNITLNLSDPISVSDELNGRYDYACVAINPTVFNGQHIMQLKAYTSDQIVFFNPVNLQSRNCESGYSTPVKIYAKEVKDYAGIITFTVKANNLGENPNIITFTAEDEDCKFGDGASNKYVYKPGRPIQVGEKIEFKFETAVDEYMKFSGKQITVSYDSDHAVLNEMIIMPSITQQGKTEVEMTVPYLFYEDFSGVQKDSESYGNNDYNTGDERKQPGYSLDGVMPTTGWNAARYWVKKDGGSFRINMRYQMVRIGLGNFGISFTTSHYGRLDTPRLSSLKQGVIANLKVTFDAGANVNSKSNGDALNGDMTYISLATHNVQTNPINGVAVGTGESGDINDFGFTSYKSSAMPNTFGAEDFSNQYPTHIATIVEATKNTRLCFYPTTAFTKQGMLNAEFNVYIDNIKVQIAK